MPYKSPFNYIGNKHKLIDRLQREFPNDINRFIDLFCGGCDVSINVSAKEKYANDINNYVIGIMQTFKKLGLTESLNKIDKTIRQWNLSKTNAEAYASFRDHYNETRDPIDLYVLICFSFNYQVRFNSEHNYNNPFGKNRSSFSQRMRENLTAFITRIKDINFSASDFVNYDYSFIKEGDFVYADPPYLITTGTYNDGKRGFRGWTYSDDIMLTQKLDALSERNVKFALSNVLEHKGQKNYVLTSWADKRGYRIIEMYNSYNNCNYQTQNSHFKTREVLIVNY